MFSTLKINSSISRHNKQGYQEYFKNLQFIHYYYNDDTNNINGYKIIIITTTTTTTTTTIIIISDTMTISILLYINGQHSSTLKTRE